MFCANQLSAQSGGHDCVDLGLSVKWATCNVGATSPEDYGDYYQWGAIEPNAVYAAVGDISGDAKYDAATANWGGSWRMPTEEELQELIDDCTWTCTERNGVNGCEVKSKKNGNSIFLPAAGCLDGDYLFGDGSDGYYWGSKPNDTDGARCLYFSGGYYQTVGWYGRGFGRSVRPVTE